MTDGGRRLLRPGSPYPLGATWDGRGVNFALFSENAEKVELCLFDPSGRHEEMRISLPEYTDQVWHGYLPEASIGLFYGYRVHGPYDPHNGHRFNPNKLLIDPYAKALTGSVHWHSANYGYRFGSTRRDMSFDRRDNARHVPKCVVSAATFPREDEARPHIPWADTVIYEAHVAGMTARHPEVPANLRGTFRGFASPAVLDHLVGLGITAVEMMPIFPFADEQHLVEKGLRNYWGYSPYSFFAPEPRYLGAEGLDSFRDMILRFHEAGIEVILDVVYNHTCEGGEMGPTLSLRGIDNASYYRLNPGDARHYIDDTGCGNSLNLAHPRVLQVVMDSLRYWAEIMHVDGFRFDLATALGRTKNGFDPNGPFLAAVRQDPVLSRVKLIAEPWDLGRDGHQLGAFPPGWSEWNDQYRDAVRAFWKGDEENVIGNLAISLTGSSVIFEHNRRRPQASINFVTAHDGFTLQDLVSYDKKHNEANLEDNRDGTDHNLSWNCGVEGRTANPAIIALRNQQKRNFIATLLLSQGVPMLLAGDELGRTQHGNNNAYCQDNEINWIDWEGFGKEDFLDFIREMLRIRREHPGFRRLCFFQGETINGGKTKDITWLSPEGREMRRKDWEIPYARCFGFHLDGRMSATQNRCERPRDHAFIALLNAHHKQVAFKLPPAVYGASWRRLIDTARPEAAPETANGGELFSAAESYPLKGRSLVLLIGKKK